MYLQPWATLHSQQVIKGFLSHEVSVQPLKELETQPLGKSTMFITWSNPSKTSGHQVSDEIPCSAILHGYCYVSFLEGVNAVYNFITKDNWKSHTWNFPELCPTFISPWLILICVLLLKQNITVKYNSFQWLLRVFFGKSVLETSELRHHCQ